MNCPKCGNKMIELFISFVCDHCERPNTQPTNSNYIGFVVWRNRPIGSQEYVFASEKDAEKWRKINNLHACPIWKVRTKGSFTWRIAGGGLQEISLASHLYRIFRLKEDLETCYIDEEYKACRVLPDEDVPF